MNPAACEGCGAEWRQSNCSTTCVTGDALESLENGAIDQTTVIGLNDGVNASVKGTLQIASNWNTRAGTVDGIKRRPWMERRLGTSG